MRRVPVVDERGCCIGMIAQADVALNQQAASESEVGRIVERISELRTRPGPPAVNQKSLAYLLS